ncbi:GGDEF domain-containing protein [uncultured Ilyobacter sp.]|uniref:GGDEF domain-containing protein n=1 Tax=uncultured Ilyobacter sp. TaxID=544433 RepID=UPI0029C02296|nr:GGDEF domain-containing protein [uncultured Ilyobacter sp.]
MNKKIQKENIIYRNLKNFFFLFLIAIYCLFIYHSYEINEEIDIFDVCMETLLAFIILILVIKINSYKTSKKIYSLFDIGLKLLFTSQVIEVMQEIFKLPKLSVNIFEDFFKVLSFSVIITAIYFTIEANEENMKKLKKIASYDKLTNIYNRQEMINRFNMLRKISNRNQNPITVIFLDVDFFKKINDTYGHPTGDTVLKELATVISSNLRDQDIFGRYGGEEFLIILPETDISGGLILSEKVRKFIYSFEFKEVSHLTVSLGVTQYKNGEFMKDTLDRLDKALYLSKNNGRNCSSFL